MRTRRVAVSSVCLVAAVLLTGCRQVITRPRPDPPPFPPDLATVVTTDKGLVLRATGELISTDPTVLRISATVTNPTTEEIVAETLLGDCQLIVAATWPTDPDGGRLVQPLDGLGPQGGPLGVCATLTGLRPFPPGETILTKSEDLILSEVLGLDFVPGRHVISAIFVDRFIYEVFALNLQVLD